DVCSSDLTRRKISVFIPPTYCLEYNELRFSKRSDRRTVEELTVRRVTGTVARAVPAMFCVVPFYDASRMSTYRIYDKYFSIRIFIDPHLLTLIFQYLAFIVSDLGEAFDLF